MFSRRDFLTSSSLLCGSVGFSGPASIFAAPSKPSRYFGVHPFVERHPEAVFILRTHVDYKTNSGECKRVGLDFGRSVFVPMDNTGIPVTYNIAAKPNLTAHQAVDKKRGFTLEDTMGIATGVFFVEGLFESLKELGVAGARMHTRDANGASVIEPRGYVAMSQRVGATVAPVKQDGVAVRRPLTSFTRTPLRSFYLHQRTKEPLWHLCNAPFNYTNVSEKKLSIPAKPVTRVLNQHFPNANNPKLAIEFSVPEAGWVLIEILDRSYNNLEVIANAICDPGYHMAAWNTAKYASGNYKYRPRYKGYNEVHDLVLNKA